MHYEEKILNVHKPVGISPLDAIRAFKEKILKKWQEKMCPQNSDRLGTGTFLVAKIKIKCSSGTYVRSIAHKLGQNLKIGAVLLGLKRTKVGDFKIKDSIKI